MKNILFLIGIILFLSGCSNAIESFHNRPVVEDKLKGTDGQLIGTLAVTSQRRLIIANLKTGGFCSEPPPETVDSITTAIAAALKANIDDKKNVNVELASNFARNVNQLYKRTHTVQLFRDAAFYLCVDSVNSANGKADSYVPYKDSIVDMVKVLKPTLDKEISLYYATEKIRAQNQPDVLQDTIICDASAVIDKKDSSIENKLSTSINCKPLTESIAPPQIKTTK